MDRTQIIVCVAYAVLAVTRSSISSAQANSAPKPIKNMAVSAKSYIRYPSLQPLTAIDVSLATPPEMIDLLQRAIGSNPQNPLWDCTKPSSYKITILSQDGKELGTEPITAVALQGNDDQGHRLTHCDGYGTVGTVTLMINFDKLQAETVQVSLVGLPTGLSAQSDGKLQLQKSSIITFSATPQAAPNEKLTNGKSRDTGQLSVSFNDSDLFPCRDAECTHVPFDTYVKSTDLFSTDEKDAKSSFAGTIGVQRGLFQSWYSPLHFDETIQGNQIATNLSAVTTLGITTLVPWAWSRPLFYNPAFQAPLPPDVTLNNQYTNRINQVVMKNSKLLATNDYSLNPSMSWSSIAFPWACTVFGWLDSTAKSKKADPAKATPATPGVQYCLGTAIDLGLYYLPLDLTKAGHQQVQGYGDVSILIPLSGLSFASKIFPLLGTNDPMKSQIRIKYSDTVTPANNYARSKGWTYGIEVIK